VVPVLDAPEDEVYDINMMQDRNTSRDLDGTVELGSPCKGGREKGNVHEIDM